MDHIFGPVLSRRLGMSLGVDLVPFKICSYDCIYCQLGQTTNKTICRKEYISHNTVLREIEEYLSVKYLAPDYITLSGSGEPTLNNTIGKIIRKTKQITEIPVAVLTNASLFSQSEVQKDLMAADVILPSLDSASKQVFTTLNRPYKSLTISGVINGLTSFRQSFLGEMWLEVLLCRGVNDDKEELQKIGEAIHRIKPHKVHLNTVARPSRSGLAYPLSLEQLEEAQKILGENTKIIGDSKKAPPFNNCQTVEQKVFDLLRRRPCTVKEITDSLAAKPEEITKIIEAFTNLKKVEYTVYGGQIYYHSLELKEIK